MSRLALDRERPRRASRKKRFQSTELAPFVMRLANANKQSPEPSNFILNDEIRPRIKDWVKAGEISGQRLTDAERKYWLQHHAAKQNNIVMEAWGLNTIIDEEGFTPRVRAMLDEKSKTIPKDWKYGVEPGSEAYAAIKRNEMEFEKWKAQTRAEKKKKQETLTSAV